MKERILKLHILSQSM